MRALSTNLLDAINGAETGDTLIALVTVTHDELAAGNIPGVPAGPIRFSSHNTTRYDDEGPRFRTVSNGLAYEFFPFRLTMPQEDDGGQPTLQLVFDNVSRELTPLLASVTTPALVTVDFVLLSDPNYVEWSLPDFALVSAELDDGQATLSLIVDAMLDEAFPGYDFTPSVAGGLWSTT